MYESEKLNSFFSLVPTKRKPNQHDSNGPRGITLNGNLFMSSLFLPHTNLILNP